MNPPVERDYAADLREARRAIEAEAEALRALGEGLDEEAFGRAVDLLERCAAQVALTGIGKSGHIAAKIAATFASVGVPAFFLHPAEALHGDLGMLTASNTVLALSQSGATDELLSMLPYLKRSRIPLIAITGREDSPLARQADVTLLTRVEKEACPLNLAPTTSTTAQLALGDALAVALMRRRGFTQEDFAMRHPLGALGRRLLMRVRDFMYTGFDNPVIPDTAPLREAIDQMTTKRLGAVSVVDAEGRLAGIFCDGDLRRLLQRAGEPLDPGRPVAEFMIRNPKTTTPDTPGAKAVDIMETWRITVLPVVDESRRVVGMIHLHDLVRAGITH